MDEKYGAELVKLEIQHYPATEDTGLSGATEKVLIADATFAVGKDYYGATKSHVVLQVRVSDESALLAAAYEELGHLSAALRQVADQKKTLP